jgi:hypothetical protein
MYLFFIWYIFPPFGMLYLEKSGNPASRRHERVGALIGALPFAGMRMQARKRLRAAAAKQ